MGKAQEETYYVVAEQYVMDCRATDLDVVYSDSRARRQLQLCRKTMEPLLMACRATISAAEGDESAVQLEDVVREGTALYLAIVLYARDWIDGGETVGAELRDMIRYTAEALALSQSHSRPSDVVIEGGGGSVRRINNRVVQAPHYVARAADAIRKNANGGSGRKIEAKLVLGDGEGVEIVYMDDASVYLGESEWRVNDVSVKHVDNEDETAILIFSHKLEGMESRRLTFTYSNDKIREWLLEAQKAWATVSIHWVPRCKKRNGHLRIVGGEVREIGAASQRHIEEVLAGE
ncbi:hypothetical protein [Thioalkalivibrio sp. ALE11]|uniref:hypothetical protein n=1 Tax=Thioalkalivibrio sp. ALE11 TaxID=1265494 RepID=UPI000475BF41|nr:hypothetical protein [Thioalkalivibrio sp. ALE11]